MRRWIKSGSPWIWLTAGSVAVSLLALAGILLLLASQGMRYFWPSPVYQFTLNQPAAGAATVIGELYRQEAIPLQQLREAGVLLPDNPPATIDRYLIKIGNRELQQRDFITLLASDVQQKSAPKDLLVIERLNNGTAYGYLVGMLENGQPLVAENLAQALLRRIPENRTLANLAHRIQHQQMAELNEQFDALRLEERKLQLDGQFNARAEARIRAERIELERQFSQMTARRDSVLEDLSRDALLLRDMKGQVHTIALSDVREAWYPNAMTLGQKWRHWANQVKQFVTENPRASNTEGGVFPAIFGTVLMVILMSVMVMPLGVIAAVYLHEYAKNNWLTRLIRISVVNLAGVPSIVYGVFGLGFFVYLVGGSLDRLLYPEALPDPTFGTPGVLWAALTLALLTLPVVIVSTEEGLSRIPLSLRHGSLALGASKSETLWRIVLPMAAPGMMTGLILAVARAAGETAPLMLVGVVKSAPVLPVDGIFPYLHLERKFMHLSFQIYDMAFQSPNVEAARPLVYATALLLVIIVVGLNLAAMGIRHSLREKYRSLGI
ncbi:phosphate ABC transporter permease PstA [Edaphovirga cremea]|uniref:phosphate ABC transporter permease PstA n=1 Tax=Edaphovirga cremea TaxID=2267246 RepID=UPI000DEFD597|nr:phosphate ABC transporter permease PstA [Edaphovirga cremea]